MSAAAARDVPVLIHEYFAAWEARDPDRIAALHSADTRFELHGDAAGPAIGQAAARRAVAKILDRFPGFAIEVQRLLLGSDHWVLDWTLVAHPDGREVRVPLLDVVTLDADGLIATKDTYLASGVTA
jgi:ketosteroid isomerase-like protein